MSQSTELREALTAAGASALIPKIISPMLLEYQRRYSPLVRAIPSLKWHADSYYFNQRTINPNGGFTIDGGARVVSNSTYVQNSFQMKHLQIVGAITGYAEQVATVNGDLRAREIEGSIQGLTWDTEQAILWGNSGATQFGAYPQFDGLDTLVNTYSGSNQNCIDATTLPSSGALTLAQLDELADMVETNSAMSVFDSNWMYVMSNTAYSKVAQLQTNQQRFLDQVEVAAGLLVASYKGIPMIKSSMLSTRNTTMGTVTGTPSGATGTIPAGAYRYQVSAVISRASETAASPEITVTVGATNIVTLAFSTLAGLDGLQPTLYKVYRSPVAGGAGTATLLGYVDATVGLAADGITPILTTSIIDNGVTLIPQNGSTQPGTFPATYQGTNTSKKPPALGREPIYLMSRDENFICRPYVREMEPRDIFPTTSSPDSLPYALLSDTTLAVRAPKYLGQLTGVLVNI